MLMFEGDAALVVSAHDAFLSYHQLLNKSVPALLVPTVP